MTSFTEADLRILGALDVPRTCNEISDVLRQELREKWAEEHGLEVAWDTDEEPVGVRALVHGWSRDRGTPTLMSWEVYPRLRKLERAGLVRRIQIPGRRPMLWAQATNVEVAAGRRRPA